MITRPAVRTRVVIVGTGSRGVVIEPEPADVQRARVLWDDGIASTIRCEMLDAETPDTPTLDAATEPGEEATYSTSWGQLAARLNALTPEQREAWHRGFIEAAHRAYLCVVLDHAGAMEQVKSWTAAAAVQEYAIEYAPTVRNTGPSSIAQEQGMSERKWHAAAIADTGTSYLTPGRLYVVQCEWCPRAFAAPTRAEAMALFRAHETPMLSPEMPATPADYYEAPACEDIEHHSYLTPYCDICFPKPTTEPTALAADQEAHHA